MRVASAVASLCLGTALTGADVIETTDGARLVGTVVGIDGGVIKLQTTYAGVLEIDQAMVRTMTTETPVTVRLQSGSVMTGPVQQSSDGEVRIQSPDGTMTTSVNRIAATWRPGDKDPAQIAMEAEIEAAKRKWEFEAAVDVTGKSGNSDNLGAAVYGSATLEGPDDEFNIYASFAYEESNSIKSAEEIIAGASYKSFFYDKLGWYVRTEFEIDEFEDIDYRSTSGAGLTYKFVRRENLKLDGQAGLSYRFESFETGGTEDSIGLDFGLAMDWRFATWGELKTRLSYIPSFEDLGDFLLTHDSGVEMPLGDGERWLLRMGIEHSYDSEPTGNLDELDTTYYLRLVLRWR